MSCHIDRDTGKARYLYTIYIMKKLIGYAMIILPVVAIAIKWQIWESNLEAVVLPLIATLACTIYNNEQSEKKSN